MQGEIHVSVHSCMNDYLRCMKCEVHNRVHKHVITSTKKHVPRFLIFEALIVHESVNMKVCLYQVVMSSGLFEETNEQHTFSKIFYN